MSGRERQRLRTVPRFLIRGGDGFGHLGVIRIAARVVEPQDLPAAMQHGTDRFGLWIRRRDARGRRPIFGNDAFAVSIR